MSESYLENVRRELRRLKRLSEAAMCQIDDAEYARSPGEDGNSVAIIVKHLSGNMRSRWRDFLTSDGERPDRDRDAEFTLTDADTRDDLTRRWEAAWEILFDALTPLEDADLTRTVVIRGEAHSVLQAINRQLSHYAYHTGQIVFLARQLAGARWRTLSVAPGQSRAFNAAPEPYLGDADA